MCMCVVRTRCMCVSLLKNSSVSKRNRRGRRGRTLKLWNASSTHALCGARLWYDLLFLLFLLLLQKSKSIKGFPVAVKITGHDSPVTFLLIDGFSQYWFNFKVQSFVHFLLSRAVRNLPMSWMAQKKSVENTMVRRVYVRSLYRICTHGYNLQGSVVFP